MLNEVKEHMLSDNLFSAVKISGTFKMHVRMMPKQEPPYTRLIDSARRQPEETREDIKGTIIGFFTPELFHGIDQLASIFTLLMMIATLVVMY